MDDFQTVEGWKQMHRQSHERLKGTLIEGQLYRVDGGIFEANYNEEEGRFALWKWKGREGNMVLRTGFEIDADGVLYDRVYNIENERQEVLLRPRYSTDQLQPLTREEAMAYLPKWRDAGIGAAASLEDDYMLAGEKHKCQY